MELSESFRRLRATISKTNRLTLATVVIAGLGLGTYLSLNHFSKKNMQASLTGVDAVEIGAFPVIEPTIKYGFALDTFQVMTGEIQPNQFLADLLGAYNVDYLSVEQLAANAKDVFDIRHLRAGKSFTILTKDPSQTAEYFIYEPNVYEYIVFQLKDELSVERVKRPMETETNTAGGVIETSLWNAMVDNGMSYELSAKMEDALQWSIDFHHLQKDDAFKLVYDQNFIDGEKVGVGNVYAAYYKNLSNEYFAVWYDHPEHEGYYDLKGRPMNSGFLKSPVKYSRISSHYNLNRFHPILKRRRPHLGTDYAAPYGTPIYAVANGVVTKAAYTRGNGNYVKIKHDDTYQTQYLHMQKFASGISPGVHVKQGQVIGYVGSTGLATGPHVCFRFWKNGKQVNHLNLNFPPPAPLPDAELPAFYEQRDKYLDMLGMDVEKELAKIEAKEDKSKDKEEKGNP